jgi:hypothetical protein
MAATVVDIVNLALARLGDEATVSSIDPPDGSAQATHCARFYPMARDAILDQGQWSFSTTRGTLNLLSVVPKSGWLYAYAPPSIFLNIIALFVSGATDDHNPQQFIMESLEDGTTVVYSNIQSPVCMYSFRVTDPSKFPPLMVESLVLLLMSYLAGPIIKGSEGIKLSQQYYSMFGRVLSLAMASDAAQRKVTRVHTPDFIAARGVNGQALDDLGGWAR